MGDAGERTGRERSTRRAFLGRGAAAAGTGLYGLNGLTVLSTKLRGTRGSLSPDGDLYFFNWAQYMNPKVLAGFEKEYKVKVHQTYFPNMQGMLTKLRAKVPYDVTF